MLAVLVSLSNNQFNPRASQPNPKFSWSIINQTPLPSTTREPLTIIRPLLWPNAKERFSTPSSVVFIWLTAIKVHRFSSSFLRPTKKQLNECLWIFIEPIFEKQFKKEKKRKRLWFFPKEFPGDRNKVDDHDQLTFGYDQRQSSSFY